MLGKAGKLGKLLGGSLKWIDDLMGKILGVTLKGLKSATDPLLTFLRAFAKKLQGGTQTALKSVKELVKGIKGWLDDKMPGWRKLKKDRVAEEFSLDDLDWMQRKSGVNKLGGKILTTRQIKALRKLLKEKYDVDLIFEGAMITSKAKFKSIGNFKTPQQLFKFMTSFRPPKVGVFDYKTRQMLLPKETSEIVVFHELAHVKHWKSLGDEVYELTSKLDREMYVWKQIFKNKERWTKDELKDALRYINDIRTNPLYGYNLDALKD